MDGATNTVGERLESEPDNEQLAELRVIESYLSLTEQISDAKKALKEADAALDAKALAKYPDLGEDAMRETRGGGQVAENACLRGARGDGQH